MKRQILSSVNKQLWLISSTIAIIVMARYFNMVWILKIHLNFEFQYCFLLSPDLFDFYILAVQAAKPQDMGKTSSTAVKP